MRKGSHHNEATVAKMRSAKLGRKRGPHTLAHRQAIAAALPMDTAYDTPQNLRGLNRYARFVARLTS